MNKEEEYNNNEEIINELVRNVSNHLNTIENLNFIINNLKKDLILIDSGYKSIEKDVFMYKHREKQFFKFMTKRAGLKKEDFEEFLNELKFEEKKTNKE